MSNVRPHENLMPTPPVSSKRTKLQTLIAVFDRFHWSLSGIPDSTVERLCENWNTYKATYSSPPPGVRPSQLAAGLEQGLLELPMMVADVAVAHRAKVARALNEALQVEYPTFLSTQQARLSKVMERGRISSESEFMLVRHTVDVAEGNVENPVVLQKLYLLIDAFEAKTRRGA
jgi:hypothetical protein